MLGSDWISTLRDRIMDQAWFLKLRSRWDELDAQSRRYLSYSLLGLIISGIVFGSWSAYDSVSSLKKDLLEKTELLAYLETASEELRQLKERGAGLSRSGESWQSYFQSKAGIAKIGPGSVEVSQGASAKSKSETNPVDEELLEVSLKKVNIRQLLRFAQHIETGERPVKLRQISIGAQSDLSGYLDAKLALSAFTLK